MYHPARPRFAMVGLSIFFAISACSDVAAPPRLAPEPSEAATFGATLIECPVNEHKSAAATLGPEGGKLRLEGHEMSLPLVAVAAPTPFTLSAPVSNYMEIRIHAGGAGHFEFDQPATITIDYSRCTRSNIDKASLSVWKIDPATKTLIQNMGGIDDKAARTLTFQSGTLSTWSIAR
jgi:hypothetical protein